MDERVSDDRLLNKVAEYPKACKVLLNFNDAGILQHLIPRILRSELRAITLALTADVIADPIFEMRRLVQTYPQMLQFLEAGEDMLEPCQLVLVAITKLDLVVDALRVIKEYCGNQHILLLVLHFCRHTTL